MNVGKLSFARLVTYKLFKTFTAHISFLVLIVKQIFEEKGKFIFIFLQIP